MTAPTPLERHQAYADCEACGGDGGRYEFGAIDFKSGRPIKIRTGNCPVCQGSKLQRQTRPHNLLQAKA